MLAPPPPPPPPRSLCYRLLKRHISELPDAGRTSAFTVYDQARVLCCAVLCDAVLHARLVARKFVSAAVGADTSRRGRAWCTPHACVAPPAFITPPLGRCPLPQDMSARLLARLVRQQEPDWKARVVNDKAAALQGAISRLKNSMLTWHAATPRVRTHDTRPSKRMCRALVCACRELWRLVVLAVRWRPALHAGALDCCACPWVCPGMLWPCCLLPDPCVSLRPPFPRMPAGCSGASGGAPGQAARRSAAGGTGGDGGLVRAVGGWGGRGPEGQGRAGPGAPEAGSPFALYVPPLPSLCPSLSCGGASAIAPCPGIPPKPGYL